MKVSDAVVDAVCAELLKRANWEAPASGLPRLSFVLTAEWECV